MRTVDAIIREQAIFTDDQRSIAWSPCPPMESVTHDCRIGGSCGLDLSGETRRSRWIVARFRWAKEAKRTEVAA